MEKNYIDDKYKTLRKVSIKERKLGESLIGYSTIFDDNGYLYQESNNKFYPTSNILDKDKIDLYKKYFDFDFEELKNSEELEIEPATIRGKTITKGKIIAKEIIKEDIKNNDNNKKDEVKPKMDSTDTNINMDEVIEKIEDRKFEIMSELFNPNNAYTSFEMNEISNKVDKSVDGFEKYKDQINNSEFDNKLDELKNIKNTQEEFIKLSTELQKIIGNKTEDNKYWTNEVDKFEREVREKYGDEIANKLGDKFNTMAKHFDNNVNIDENFNITGIQKENENKNDNNKEDINNKSDVSTTTSDNDDKDSEKGKDDNDIEKTTENDQTEPENEDIKNETEAKESLKDKIIKKKCKVVKVVKNTLEWFKKHPKAKLVAIGLALLVTSPFLAQGIMMINSTAWHVFNALPGSPLCGLLNSINKGLSVFARFGSFSYSEASGLYTLGGAAGAQAMYTSVGAALYTALGALGVKRLLKNKTSKEPIPKEPTIENPEPEKVDDKENTPENDPKKEKEPAKEKEQTKEDTTKKNDETKKTGSYHPGLTEEQLEELKTNGLKPGDGEYIQYLHNHGLTPRPEDYLKMNQNENLEKLEQANKELKEQNSKLQQENEKLKKEVLNSKERINDLRSTLKYVMKELEELKRNQNKEPLQIAENEAMSRGYK